MNIAHIESQSFIYGPGCRFVIWVQGCSIHCKGCWNTQMWSFDRNQVFSVKQLFDMIVEKNVEGITILGGEPLDQFEEVYKLCEICKLNGFSVMIFTGYELSEIDQSEKQKIISVSDILIVGRYIEEYRTLERQWIGSTNQEILFLSDRYKNYELKNGNYLEVDINENGKLTIYGFPKNDFWVI